MLANLLAPLRLRPFAGVKEDIQRTTGLQGDRGVMERARDAITGKE